VIVIKNRLITPRARHRRDRGWLGLPGNKCHNGTAGSSHGKFTGNFFGD
jgi:hypothetical protein